MESWLSRTAILLGEAGIEKLRKSRVAVFGLGGVGGYAVEALARSGVGELHLADADTVSLTNLNRQILATQATIGRLKTEAAKERVLSIAPSCHVFTYELFYLPEKEASFPFEAVDYIIDAVDTVSAKIALAEAGEKYGVPVISAMGAGSKIGGSFEVADIYKTSGCPLARVMRRELRKRGIERLKVVYSKELPVKPHLAAEEAPPPGRNSIPGSIAHVPGICGLMLAGEVISDLLLTGKSSGGVF